MKTLYDYISEEAGGAAAAAASANATPANTMGIGNPMLPDGDQIGTEGVPADPSNSKNKKPRKPKSKKEKKEDSVTRTDEALIFPWKMFATELAKILGQFRVKMICTDDGLELEDERGRVVHTFPFEVDYRTLNRMVLSAR